MLSRLSGRVSKKLCLSVLGHPGLTEPTRYTNFDDTGDTAPCPSVSQPLRARGLCTYDILTPTARTVYSGIRVTIGGIIMCGRDLPCILSLVSIRRSLKQYRHWHGPYNCP